MHPLPLLALLVLQQPQQQSAQAVARLSITPASRTVTAGDTLRLHAAAFDSQGRPVPGVRITFVATAGMFEAHVDTSGLVYAGAPTVLPVTAVAFVPGSKPVVERIQVTITPGPAARVAVAPRVKRMVVGQRIHLDARPLSATGDARSDKVTWHSSAPGVVQVNAAGTLVAVAPGRATISAEVGNVVERLEVDAIPNTIGSIDITPSPAEGRTGDVIHFKAVVKDRSGKEIPDLTPNWQFAPGQGQIYQDGTFVGYDPGAYQVTANFGTRTAETAVTLAPRDVRRTAKVVGKVIRSAFATSEVWIHPNGKVAYLGSIMGGDRVYTIDVSDPSNPAVVDSIIVNARTINDVMTTPDGNYMVITREGAADRKNGIVIADTHDPLHPKAISEFTDGVTSGVHSAFIFQQPKYGTHIYLTNDGTGALHIIDINDPYHPKEVGRWKTPRPIEAARMLHDIDVQDGLLYASYWNDGLVILDIGNGVKGGSPSNPQFVSQFKYDLNALYRDVEKEGGPGFIRGTHTAWRHNRYVFIADEVFGNDAAQALFSGGISRAHGRLQVVDVSDIEHPKSVAWYEPEYGGVHNVWIAGDTLYLGAYNAGFHAFDISGELRGDLRAQGREIASFSPTDANGKTPNATMTWGVVVKNNLSYVNDLNSGLWIVRLEPRTQPVP